MIEQGLDLFRTRGVHGIDDPRFWQDGSVRPFLHFFADFFPMTYKERSTLIGSTEQSITQMPVEHILDIISASYNKAAIGLQGIGLTPEWYAEAVFALANDDHTLLQEIIETSESAMQRPAGSFEVSSKWDPIFSQMLQDDLDSVPSQLHPTVTWLVGACGAGKSKLAQADPLCDRAYAIHTDIDQVRKRLDPSFDPRNQHQVALLRPVAAKYTDMLTYAATQAGKPMVFHVSLANDAFWRGNTTLQHVLDENHYERRTIIAHRAGYECLKRTVLRGLKEGSDGRMVALADVVHSLGGYDNAIHLAQEYKSTVRMYDFVMLAFEKHGSIATTDFARMTRFLRSYDTARVPFTVVFEQDQLDIEIE